MRWTSDSSEEPEPKQETTAAKHTQAKPQCHRRSDHCEESQSCGFSSFLDFSKGPPGNLQTAGEKPKNLIARDLQTVESIGL